MEKDKAVMLDLRFFVVPGLLLAAIVGYVTLNPAGASVEPLPTETPAATETQTASPRPTYTSTPAPTAVPAALQLDGLSGTLTYQSSSGRLVSVAFPSGAAVEPPIIDNDAWNASDDGFWRQDFVCADDAGCSIGFLSRDGRSSRMDGEYFVLGAAWQPGGHAIAIGLADTHDGATKRIIVIDDPAAPLDRVAYDAGSGIILAFEWAGDGLLVAHSNGLGTQLRLADVSGGWRAIGDYSTAIDYLHPSPDGRTFAFTVSDPRGWRLMTVDSSTGAVIDRGAMGSDGPGGLPVPDAPDGGKGPMYIGWSPDGSKLAFGGGFEPPYMVTVVDLRSGGVARSEFPSGYPGEIKWSPDGARIAVSTYDIERTHYETWIVDPVTGAGTHLMDGCVIIWSPDSRFLAVHGEDLPGIAIMDIASHARMQLTTNQDDVPLIWTP
jgi:WD40 repeat protein